MPADRTARTANKRRTFGALRELPSGRWQASYVGPNGKRYTARTTDGTGLTFDTRRDADAWLARQSAAISTGQWADPDARPTAEATTKPVETFRVYALAWLETRTLAARTKDLYRSLLDRRILPTFGDLPLTEITPTLVRLWHAEQDKPTAKAHAYAVLRTILTTAVADGLIPANPAHIKGAGQARREKEPVTAELTEIAALRAVLPEHYRSALDLGLWCSLRIGEVCGLQRADVDLTNAVVRVRRSAGRTAHGPEVKAPKSAAGVRDVTIPASIVPALREHLDAYTAPGRTAWVFPAGTDKGKPLSADVLREAFVYARKKIGRPDLRFHDLRATGATLAARVGATVAELQARLGHTTPNMAMRYQRVAHERPREIADRLSALNVGAVVPIESAKRSRKGA